MAFFDQYNLRTIYRLKTDLNKMKDDKTYYLKEIEATKSQVEQLNSDIYAVEKFARENYFMKREDEDIFIITKP